MRVLHCTAVDYNSLEQSPGSAVPLSIHYALHSTLTQLLGLIRPVSLFTLRQLSWMTFTAAYISLASFTRAVGMQYFKTNPAWMK